MERDSGRGYRASASGDGRLTRRAEIKANSPQTAKGFRAPRHLSGMKLIASLLLLGIGPSMGLACSCAPGSGCWSVSTEGLEFVGKATKVHAAGGGAVSVDFAVSEAFGKLSGKTALTVYTNAQSTACGYPFRLGVEYFVSANSIESKLWANSCGPTRPAIVAAAMIRQARAIHTGQPPARLFGFIGTEPYPGVSPLSRLEAKPAASIAVTAVGRTGEFRTATVADGSFEFTGLPESTYHLRVQLPKDLFIWWASANLHREYAVSPGKMCEADFPLYPKDDPFAANQPR